MPEAQIGEFIGKFGLAGAVVLALLLYRKPLLVRFSDGTYPGANGHTITISGTYQRQ